MSREPRENRILIRPQASSSVVRRREQSSPRTMIINGRRTSMRLEPAFLLALRRLARQNGEDERRTVERLLADAPEGNISARLRSRLLISWMKETRSVVPAQPGHEHEIPLPFEGQVEWSRLVARETVEREGPNVQRKLMLRLEALDLVPDLGLHAPLRAWFDLRASRGRPPTLDELRDAFLWLPQHQERFNLVDVGTDAPPGYRIIRHTQLELMRRHHPDLSSMTIGDYPVRMHARGLQHDFMEVKYSGEPRLDALMQAFEMMGRYYLRVTLPVGAGGREITSVVSLSAHLPGPWDLRH